MKKTKLIGIFIVILVCILFGLLIIMIDLKVLRNENINQTIDNTSINENKNDSNVVNDNVTLGNQVENEQQNAMTEDEYIDFYGDGEQIENMEYTPEQLNNFSFELQGMTDDILRYITDIEKFNQNIKEYIYKHGLVDATIGTVSKYEYQESTNRLGIIFDLNNPSNDKLLVIINANGSIDITKK